MISKFIDSLDRSFNPNLLSLWFHQVQHHCFGGQTGGGPSLLEHDVDRKSSADLKGEGKALVEGIGFASGLDSSPSLVGQMASM
mmetsp:Transcript_21395/g.52423  ORF Transcript_21395/g.52423 Transcript_21395/m.52423 type:complete len:84 (+) Transcript_21395:199-450(+)